MSRLLILTALIIQMYAAPLSVHIATDEYAPYIDSTLENKGWMYELTKKAFEVSNIKMSADFMPWARAVFVSKEGKDYDALLAAFKTEEREQWYLFSQPLTTVRMGLFKRKDKSIPFDGTLSSLEPYMIAKGRGFYVTEEFDKNTKLNIYEVNQLNQAVKMLWLKRVDLLVGTEVEALMEIRKNEIYYPGITEGIIFLNPPLTSNTVHLAISKKSPHAKEYLKLFNNGLQKLLNNGTYKKLSESTPY